MKKVVFIGVPVVLTLAAGVITFVRIKKIGSDVYQLKDYDSVKISNGKWFRYSRGYGGYNALDFLIKVRGMDFKDAVQYLIDGRFNYLLIVISVTNETIEQAQNQIKILRSITNAPIAVIADEPVDAQIKIAALTNGAD